jgi:beta-1,4-mannosyltransferase
MIDSPLTVAFLPIYQNPYQHLLTAALARENVKVLHLDAIPSSKWLQQKRIQVKILHLHWLSGLYMQRWLTPLRIVSFLMQINYAQRLGYKIVWTAHNILPHKLPLPPVHRFIRRFIMKRADAVITHCQFGKDELLRRFPRQKPVFVVPHGNYQGVHPVNITRKQARSLLGLSDTQFVYLLIGNISPYKGIESFVQMFQKNAMDQDIVLIAGRNRAPKLVNQLQVLAAKDNRIRIYPGFIQDGDMQRYLLSADVAVFTFEDILTSGSVILALSYGLPVIAPAIGCLPELITPETGYLYDPGNCESLRSAFDQIKIADRIKMGQAAIGLMATLRWDKIAEQTVKIYQACLS